MRNLFATAIVAGSALIGGGVGFYLAWISVTQAAQLRMDESATHLGDKAHRAYQSALSDLSEAAVPVAPACGAEDLRQMRRIVFDSGVVKDIGRIEGNYLLCTTSVGQLAEPVELGEPDHVSEDGVQWYPNVELLASENATALILERGAANVVIDSRALIDADHATRLQFMAATDPSTGEVTEGLGSKLPFELSEVKTVFQSGHGHLNYPGWVGALRCHTGSAICAIEMQRADAAMAGSASTFILMTLMGMTTGGGAGGYLVLLLCRRARLPARLRRAIAAREITLAYQPQVNFISWNVIGCEALARWTDRSGEAVPVEAFISAAEENGFISDLTRLIIERTVEDLAPLLRADPDFTVAINFSAQDLSDTKLLLHLQMLLRHERVACRQVTIELTERAAGNSPAVRATLAAARAAGHKVAIDDFGVGYSNLSQLQKMPVDYLKIDKSFTDSIGKGAIRSTLVPQIMDVANTLGLGVIVEGTEDESQLVYLRQLGAQIGQGWYFGKAMPLADFQTWLEAWKGSVTGLQESGFLAPTGNGHAVVTLPRKPN